MIEQLTIGTADVKDNLASVVLTQLSRLDGAIEKEFTLVSDRMTWMMISESFIFWHIYCCGRKLQSNASTLLRRSFTSCNASVPRHLDCRPCLSGNQRCAYHR